MSTAGLRRRPLFRGPAGERGAIAVAVALLFPLFFGAAALAVDTAAAWNARAQVVSGVDAAVLALATDCASGRCTSRSDVRATVDQYLLANTAGARSTDLVPGGSALKVDAGGNTAHVQGSWTVEHFFAGMLGVPDEQITAAADARWAGATDVAADIPVAVSWCTYRDAVATYGVGSTQSTATLPLKTSTSGSCTAPGGATIDGGSNQLRPGDGTCSTASAAVGSSVLTNNTSRSAPAACTTGYLAALRDTDIRVPVYDQVAADGKSVRVYGYAAFRVTAVTAVPASVTGYFTYAVQPIDTPSTVPSVPDLGARVVFLADPTGG